MNQISSTASHGVLIYKCTTFGSIALTLALFGVGYVGDLTRTLLFVGWLALQLFACIRLLSDKIGERGGKGERFERTIALLEESTGDRRMAERNFYAMQTIAGLLKLALPVVFWMIYL